MEDKKKTRKNYQYIYCDTCNGAGVFNGKECPDCHGQGTVVWTGKYILYWGRVIDEAHIVYRKTTEVVHNAIDMVILLFGIFGFGLAFYVFVTYIENMGENISAFMFWNANNWEMFIFWISLIADTYLLFRFMRRVEKLPTIPKSANFFTSENIPLMRWGDVKKILLDETFDISSVFAPEAIKAIEKAYQYAKTNNISMVNSLHLFLVLFSFPEVISIFVRLGISFEELYKKLAYAIKDNTLPASGKIIFEKDIQRALFESFLSAISEAQKRVFLSDVILGTIKSSHALSEILYDVKINETKILNVSLWMKFQRQLKERYHKIQRRAVLRPKSDINRAMTSRATPFLDSVSEDLTLYARAGYLEPCVSRDKEIEEIFRIMEGGTRQSVILVGYPGVGKKEVINGIASLMVSDQVPKILQDKRLVNLSISRIVSGVSASKSEERLLLALNEAIKSGNIFLLINDISKMIGITIGSSGSLDIASVLAESIARKNIHVIATATHDDYVKYIERHNLGSVLEKIDIKELKGNDVIRVLESKVGMIEYRYKIFFSYDAIEKAVQLSDRYLHERYMPEKAIVILEEAAAEVYAKRGKDATVYENDIAIIVSRKVNIPLADISESESEKLLHLEEKIHERMIDQDEAVKMVSSALRRARVEIRDIKRPIANLLFLGPTGVGKTQLAKTVASIYFGDEHEMIRLDMSEYQEKSSISRLIGTPVSMTEEGSLGYLTENVRSHPFALLLLDEIEKAHPDILNIFLQVMDDGRLTDAFGRTVDFTNIILICTSNACTPYIQKRVIDGISAQQIKEEILNNDLLKYFRPEFLNRFDGIIVFKPLDRKHILEIAYLLLKDVSDNLEKKGIQLQITQAAAEELAEAGFDPKFGARPMRRVIQERVDDAITYFILSGQAQRRDTIVLDVGGKVEILKSKKL